MSFTKRRPAPSGERALFVEVYMQVLHDYFIANEMKWESIDTPINAAVKAAEAAVEKHRALFGAEE